MTNPPSSRARIPAFSLLFFASQSPEYKSGKFELFRETTKLADRLGFEAVWIPERHFHSFGGIFPNPSLAAAYIADQTTQIRLRAGSVVLPLHHPIRVAEEWAVVDNLSNGRVDIAFAVGWNPTDFVLSPQSYASRHRLTFDGIEQVRRLWRGESLEYTNGSENSTLIGIHPLPVQKELNVWITCSGGPARFVEAGEKGFNILTALLFQQVDELADKVAAYRQARRAAGHAGRGHVTLMLHTYVGQDEAETRSTVLQPFRSYIESSADLWFGANRLQELSERQRNKLLDHAFERYYQKAGLMGSAASCRGMVQEVSQVGVDEIACLVDFGLTPENILSGLSRLHELRLGMGRIEANNVVVDSL